MYSKLGAGASASAAAVATTSGGLSVPWTIVAIVTVGVAVFAALRLIPSRKAKS